MEVTRVPSSRRARARASPAEPEVDPAAVAAASAASSANKELKETADYLIRYKLQTVPGIIRITSHGGERRQYEVTLEPERMRNYGVSLDEPLRMNFKEGRRFYYFNPKPWRKSDLEKL